MTRTRILPFSAGLLAAALLLSACGPGDPDDAATTPPPAAETETATPTASPTPDAAAFTLPASCGTIASAATMATVFADVPERPADGLTRPAPASATLQLECSWFTGDTTGGDVLFSSAPAADSAAYLTTLQADGFTCSAALEGTRCDKTTPNSQYPVDTVETVFTRDDVWIWIGVTNIDGTSLLPDIVATGWAA